MIHSDILDKEYHMDIHFSEAFLYPPVYVISVGLSLVMYIISVGPLFVCLCVYLSGAFVVCLCNAYCRVWPYWFPAVDLLALLSVRGAFAVMCRLLCLCFAFANER